MKQLVGFLATLTIAFLVSGQEQPQRLGFFVTSVTVGPDRGGDLGGLAGADAHCAKLAAAVGAGDRMWRAYLSAFDARTGQPVNARDRIGSGPWHNAKGDLVAENLEDLHRDDNGINAQTALDERGQPISGIRHDILTGSNADGTLASGSPDGTCSNWTSNQGGRAIVGHHDKPGARQARSWNAAHPTTGCSRQQFENNLGAGLFYCFAAD